MITLHTDLLHPKNFRCLHWFNEKWLIDFISDPKNARSIKELESILGLPKHIVERLILSNKYFDHFLNTDVFTNSEILAILDKLDNSRHDSILNPFSKFNSECQIAILKYAEKNYNSNLYCNLIKSYCYETQSIPDDLGEIFFKHNKFYLWTTTNAKVSIEYIRKIFSHMDTKYSHNTLISILKNKSCPLDIIFKYFNNKSYLRNKDFIVPILINPHSTEEMIKEILESKIIDREEALQVLLENTGLSYDFYSGLCNIDNKSTYIYYMGHISYTKEMILSYIENEDQMNIGGINFIFHNPNFDQECYAKLIKTDFFFYSLQHLRIPQLKFDKEIIKQIASIYHKKNNIQFNQYRLFDIRQISGIFNHGEDFILECLEIFKDNKKEYENQIRSVVNQMQILGLDLSENLCRIAANLESKPGFIHLLVIEKNCPYDVLWKMPIINDEVLKHNTLNHPNYLSQSSGILKILEKHNSPT